MATKLEEQIKNYYSETVRAFLSLIEEKDASIKAHSERVARMCLGFCKKLGVASGDAQKIYLAGLLHDLGLIYVPVEILQKPDPLSEGDMAMIKIHPVLTEKVIANLSFLAGIIPIVRHHHEWVDGSGFPDGLQGNAIPHGARILCLIDRYDAMIAGYPYRQAMSQEAAVEEINKNAGSHFDGSLIKDFLDFIRLSAASEAASQRSSEKQKKNSILEAVQQIIDRFKENKLDLPVLPKVVMEIQKAIRNPIATTDDIAKLIEQDAVMSLRLITIANSAVYRGVDKVQTVRLAVPRLGIKQTQSVVSTIANKGLYKSSNEQFMTLLEKLWAHSLATAYAARSIGEKLKHEDVEKLYLMGLFHDIGKALLLRGMDIIFSKSPSVNMAELTTAVQEAHSGFGSAILQRWGFTEDFVRTANMHNEEKFFPTTQKEILIINLASMLTRKIGFSLFNDEALDLSAVESAKLLELDAAALTAVCEETTKKMNDTSNIF